ncbi:hypothetical protein LCGC14_1957440 [marine sediment metagenome]|uniref:Uncharacterized protein n=1 Tax=marine sediment metagenome TaxID=412755 RepID=A0A0F9FFU0_9ZZZZ
MKRESSWGVIGLIALVGVCCFGPILALSVGAGVLAALVGHWPYALTGFIVVLMGLIFFIYLRVKVQRKKRRLRYENQEQSS